MPSKRHAPRVATPESASPSSRAAGPDLHGSNSLAAAHLAMPPVLPVLGIELFDWLDRSLGAEDVDMSGVDSTGPAVAADPAPPPSCDPPPDVCDPLAGDDRDVLYRLAELLTYDRYTDRITDVEVAEARDLLDCLSEEGRAQFLSLNGGQLADRLLVNPDGEGWITNPLGNLADRPMALADAAWSWWSGDEALEVAQAGMGGSIEGVTLDTSQDNSVDVSTNIERGELSVTVPNLSIASMRYAASGSTVTSGPGTVLLADVTLDLPDAKSSALSAEVDIHSIDWEGLRVVTDAMTAAIPKVVISSVWMAALQASIDPQVVARATVAPALARAAMTAQLSRVLVPQLSPVATLMAPLMLGATRQVQDGEVMLREAAELGAVDAMDLGMRIGSIDVPRGVTLTQRTTVGESTTTLDSLHLDGIAVALKQVDRLQALGNEARALAGCTDALDQERLRSIQSQIDALQPKAQRRAELEQKAQAGPLHPNEQTELSFLARELSAGMMTLSIGSISCSGVDADGNQLDKVDIMDLSVDALGSALAVRLQDQPTPGERAAARAQGLDDLRARRAGAPNLPSPGRDLPLWAWDDEIDVSGSAGVVEAGLVQTAYGSTDHAAAEGVAFRGNADVLGITARAAQADDLDALGLSADQIAGRSADLRVRGNDIGGHISAVTGDDLAYAGAGIEASASHGQARSISFDADARSQTLRSGRIERGHATDLDYADSGQHVVAASASAENITGRGVNTTGADHIGVAGVDLTAGRYTRHAKEASVDAEGEAIEPVSGIDASFDTARLDDVIVRDATTDGTGAVDVAHLRATGVHGELHGTGSGHANELDLDALFAERRRDGSMDARVGQLTAAGVHGEMPGTAAGGASRVELRDLNARLESDGSGSVDISGGSIDDAAGVYGESLFDPTAVGQADRVTFGAAGLDFNEDYELTGAEVNDLQGVGITAELLKLPLDEVSEAEDGPSETFHADALAGMSGRVSLEIPFGERGYVTVDVAAVDGFVAFNTLEVRHHFVEGESGVRLPMNALATSVQVDEGRGIVIGVGTTKLWCLMDDREYAGLVSRRQGGGRRGGVDVQAFIEGIMNGVVTGEEELAVERSRVERRIARRHARYDRRDARRAARRPETQGPAPEVSLQDALIESVADLYPIKRKTLRFRPSETRVTAITGDLGSGTLGYDNMSLTLDDSAGDDFVVRGSLQSSLVATTKVWSASDATYLLDGVTAVHASTLGLRGVEFTVKAPLSTDRAVEVHASGGEIERVTYGSRGQVD